MKNETQIIPKNLVLFDGVCNLCNASVQFVIKHDKNNIFYFAALQSKIGQEILKKNNLSITHLDTVIYLKNNQTYTKSSAALHILKDLKGFWQLGFVFIIIPKFLRDLVYNFISKRRYLLFGKMESCMLPTPALKAKFLG